MKKVANEGISPLAVEPKPLPEDITLIEKGKIFEDPNPLGKIELPVFEKKPNLPFDVDVETLAVRQLALQKKSENTKEKKPSYFQRNTFFLPGAFKNTWIFRSSSAVKSFFVEKKYLLYFQLIKKAAVDQNKPKKVKRGFSLGFINRRHGVNDVEVTRRFLQRVHNK